MGKQFVVQQSFPTPRPTTNPYVTMVASSVAAVPGVEVRTFTWPGVLLRRFDVFHVHWPENLVSGRTPATTAVRQVLFLLLLMKLRITHTPLVRTVHNLDLPAGLTRRQVHLLRLAERQTALRIRLNPFTEVPAGSRHATILHGHYRNWFAAYPRRGMESGRILFFGLIRRYKGVDGLVRAFAELPGEHALTLRIAGLPSTDQLADELRSVAAHDHRVSLELRYLSDAELVDEVSRAELVVLPTPDMHNSGSVLAALSLDRPVLVPDNPVNRSIADETGPGWVTTFSGDLSGADLLRALSTLRLGTRAARPALDQREWSDVGSQHVRAYRAAADSHRRGPPVPTSAPAGRSGW